MSTLGLTRGCAGKARGFFKTGARFVLGLTKLLRGGSCVSLG